MNPTRPRRPYRPASRSAQVIAAQASAKRRADFLKRHRFTEEQFNQTALEWGVLDQIQERHKGMLAELQTTATCVVERLQTVPAVHSLKSRIKEADHLVAKIIRKKCEGRNFAVDCATYDESITDLVGVRVLHLFKDDWRPIHDFVKSAWELHEAPIAYVREGDGDPRAFADAGCQVETHPFGYRSIHYVIKLHPTKRMRLVELQVRTIFEEGWSEIDHKVRYPRQSDDPQLASFLTLFNRLAGSADEMGTFTKILATNLREQAAREKESARQIQEKEAELKRTISQLQISKEEKSSLQRQIAEINRPTQRAEAGGLAGHDLPASLLPNAYDLYGPFATSIFNRGQVCRICERPFPCWASRPWQALWPLQFAQNVPLKGGTDARNRLAGIDGFHHTDSRGTPWSSTKRISIAPVRRRCFHPRRPQGSPRRRPGPAECHRALTRDSF